MIEPVSDMALKLSHEDDKFIKKHGTDLSRSAGRYKIAPVGQHSRSLDWSGVLVLLCQPAAVQA